MNSDTRDVIELPELRGPVETIESDMGGAWAKSLSETGMGEWTKTPEGRHDGVELLVREIVGHCDKLLWVTTRTIEFARQIDAPPEAVWRPLRSKIGDVYAFSGMLMMLAAMEPNAWHELRLSVDPDREGWSRGTLNVMMMKLVDSTTEMLVEMIYGVPAADVDGVDGEEISENEVEKFAGMATALAKALGLDTIGGEGESS